jgi:hypothetical protein
LFFYMPLPQKIQKCLCKKELREYRNKLSKPSN